MPCMQHLHIAPNVRPTGFTVIELLVVLAAVALLLAVATPRYVQHVDHARELTLKTNLQSLREAIDKFHADQSRPPTALAELVQRGYLRRVPVDPITQRDDSWVLVPATNAVTLQVGQPSGGSNSFGLLDVRSGAPGVARDGTAYASW